MDIVRLNQFPSVAANAQATLVTDELLDRSVHALVFEMGGTTFTKAQLSSIRVRLDGKDILPGISGTQLQELNDYDGLPDDAGYLYWFFGDPTAQTIRGQHLGDLDLSIYRKPLEVQVQIAGATAPTLQCHALTSIPKMAMGIGFGEAEAVHTRALVRTVIQPAGAVSRKSFGISYGSAPGARLRRIAFFHSNITSVEYKKSSMTKVDDISAALNNSVVSQYARIPQAGLFMLDRVFDGNQGEAETTVDPSGRPWNQQISLTTSGGDTITTYADIHAPWTML